MTNSLSFTFNLWGKYSLSSPFYRWKKWVTEKLSSLSKITQQARSRAGINQAFEFRSLTTTIPISCFSYLHKSILLWLPIQKFLLCLALVQECPIWMSYCDNLSALPTSQPVVMSVILPTPATHASCIAQAFCHLRWRISHWYLLYILGKNPLSDTWLTFFSPILRVVFSLSWWCPLKVKSFSL